MKAETLFERPRIEGSGDALKQGLKAFGARARDAGLATLGFNKARGRLSIRIITDKLIRDFWTYIGAHDIHPVTDDTVRDYISRFYDQQLADVEPTIQQLAGGGQPQTPQGQAPQGTQPPQPTPGAPVANTQTWTAPTGPQANAANIASTRQSTPADMARYQKLLGQINQSVMNPTPDPQFMNKIAALLKSASGSKNLRQYAKQKIDELKARPDVVQRYPEIANIGDDPFASPPPSGYSTTGTQAGGAPMPPANTPYTLNPAAPSGQPNIATAMQGMGQAIGKNLYDMLWAKLMKGDLTELGTPSAELQAAKQALDSGAIKSRDDFETWLQNWARQRKAGNPATPAAAAPPPAATGGWRPVRPDEIFQPGGQFRMNQTTGQSEVYEPAPAAAPAAPAAAGNRFNRVQPPPLNQPQNDNAQPELSATQAVAQIGPIMSKPTVTPQERWWVMAAINNALQTTQRGTPQRQQIIATLRSLQNDPRVASKIPQLRQIPMESHQRVFDLAVFLVENQIADKTALREAYCHIMLEATALNRGQIDQIFTVLARSLSHAGLASTQLRGKAGQKQAAQAAHSQGNAVSLSQGHNLMKKTITASGLAFAQHYFNIPPAEMKFIDQLIGTNGAQVQDIIKAYRTQKKKLTPEIADLLRQAAQYSP